MEKRELVWLDLCSGLGGASQPALDHGWKVIRVDIDPRFRPDIVADVRALPLGAFPIDVLWASPPCVEFSKFGLRCFYPNPTPPDLSIVRAVKNFIERTGPRFWWVENVRASRPWLQEFFGPVRANIPGHSLWSNQIVLLPNIQPHKSQSAALTNRGVGAIPNKKLKWRGSKKLWQQPAVAFGPKRYGVEGAVAAKIPYEIGEAICRAVEQRHEHGEA